MVMWDAWQATAKAHIADSGVWFGLLNEDWEPIATISPRDVNEVYTRLTSPELSFDVDVPENGVSVAVDELIAPDLGTFDESGRFEAANIVGRSVCVQRGDDRQAYFIPYVDASGKRSPETVHVEASGLLSLLEATPCPSIPESWRGDFSVQSGDAAGKYVTPREYSLVEFATRADGYTVTGPAEFAIRTVIQDSLDAVQKHMGWEEPHMVVDYAPTGRKSPEAAIRVEDDFILPTVAETARTAGVNISASLWWPGDSAVTARISPLDKEDTEGRTWGHPIAVIHVEQMEARDE